MRSLRADFDAQPLVDPALALVADHPYWADLPGVGYVGAAVGLEV